MKFWLKAIGHKETNLKAETELERKEKESEESEKEGKISG